MYKTAFVVHNRLYRYIRMSFRLENVSTISPRPILIILAPGKELHALVYLDDAIIFSKSLEEHIQHVEPILQLMQKADIILKLKKSFFVSDAI